MVTNNMNRNTNIDPVKTGDNYGRLAIYGGVAVIITGLLVAAMWYSYYYYPFNTVLGGEEAQPLREQVPLEIMPALPSSLEEQYDNYTNSEIERVNTFGFIDEAEGLVHIPLSEAQALLLEEGFPVRTEGAAAEEESTSEDED